MADLRTWRIHAFGSLPMMGRTKLIGVYSDGESPGEVIATLEGRGVVFMQVIRAQQ